MICSPIDAASGVNMSFDSTYPILRDTMFLCDGSENHLSDCLSEETASCKHFEGEATVVCLRKSTTVLVAYPTDKSKAPLLHYICYCIFGTYSYIHAIHNRAVGRNHNSLSNTS